MKTLIPCVLFLFAVQAWAQPEAPWGSAQSTETQYQHQKVVYDVAVDSVEKLSSVLDRASYLSLLNGADPFENSIVLVLHGDEIAFFGLKNYPQHKDLMIRAQSLTVGGIIKIKMCKIAAQHRGYAPQDIHGFVEMVPMGDAEIVRLQQEEGHAYMR